MFIILLESVVKFKIELLMQSLLITTFLAFRLKDLILITSSGANNNVSPC
ncbi:hypothetical protein ES707_12642 [subsurface metagenome]